VPGVDVMLHGFHLGRGVRSQPVLLEPAAQVLAGLLQAVLMEDDVPHLQRALRQLLGRHHLHVHVLGLRLAAGLDEALEDFGGGDLEVHEDGVEGGLEELAGVVDGVAVEDDELQGFAQLEDSLDLVLDLDQVGSSGVGALDEGAFGRIVHGVLLGEGDVGGDAGDDDAALETALQVVE